MKELLDRISDIAEKLFQASKKEVDQYDKLRELKRRNIALKMISVEKQNPGACSAKEIEEIRALLQLKGTTFARINLETLKNADDILNIRNK